MMEKKKIAVIFEGDSSDIKGAFSATHNRVKSLIELNQFDINAYLIQSYENSFIRFLRHSKKKEKLDEFILENITYKNLWVNFSLIDYFLLAKLHTKPFVEWLRIKKWSKLFQKYDLISAHSEIPGKLALIVNKKYKIPFAVTWHGSDIHFGPFNNKSTFKLVKNIIEKAIINFFVSNKLKEISEKITTYGNKMILYNGVNRKKFRKFTSSEKYSFAEKYKINLHKTNVGFIGNLKPIKNVECLPKVFCKIKEALTEVEFYIIGDGNLKDKIENEFKIYEIPVRFLGNKAQEEMPGLINCLDLIVLPSLNEGLPLIALEALACETAIVGSNVGGIPEVLGKKNCVRLDDNFNNIFAQLCVQKLRFKSIQNLQSQFEWNATAVKENKVYSEIFQKIE